MAWNSLCFNSESFNSYKGNLPKPDVYQGTICLYCSPYACISRKITLKWPTHVLFSSSVSSAPFCCKANLLRSAPIYSIWWNKVLEFKTHKIKPVRIFELHFYNPFLRQSLGSYWVTEISTIGGGVTCPREGWRIELYLLFLWRIDWKKFLISCSSSYDARTSFECKHNVRRPFLWWEEYRVHACTCLQATQEDYPSQSLLVRLAPASELWTLGCGQKWFINFWVCSWIEQAGMPIFTALILLRRGIHEV